MKKVMIVLSVLVVGHVIYRAAVTQKFKDKAAVCMEGKDPQQALDACAWLRDHSKSPDFHAKMAARRGAYLEKLERDDEALAEYKAAAELGLSGKAKVPAESLLLICERAAELGSDLARLEDAARYGRLAAERGSKQPQVYLVLALVEIEGKKYADALAWLGRAEAAGFLTDKRTLKAQFYYTRGRARLELGDAAAALEDLFRAEPLMTDEKGRARINRQLGRALHAAGRRREAAPRLRAALEAGNCPECPELLGN